jgi:hypothetical protein
MATAASTRRAANSAANDGPAAASAPFCATTAPLGATRPRGEATCRWLGEAKSSTSRPAGAGDDGVAPLTAPANISARDGGNPTAPAAPATNRRPPPAATSTFPGLSNGEAAIAAAPRAATRGDARGLAVAGTMRTSLWI